MLYHQPGAVGLRQLAGVAGIHPHSAELALAALLREKLVSRRRASRRMLYQMNREHPDAVLLAVIFTASAQAMMAQRRSSLNLRAQTILPLIEELGSMLACARGSLHVA